MIKTLGKVWRYIKRYKKLLIISIVSLLIVQVLNLLSPLIVKSIMDDYLIKITNPWYLVTEDKGEVSYLDSYYNQEDISDEGLVIVIYNGKYYLSNELIDESFINGNKELIDVGNNLSMTFTNQRGETTTKAVILLDAKTIKIFYEPFINPLIVLVILLALRLFLAILFSYIQRLATMNINVNIVRDARIDAANTLQRVSMTHYDKEPAGKIANRLIHDVGGMMGLFSTIMNLVINASLSIIFAYIGMFYLDYKLALFTFIIFPLIYFWLKYFVRNLNNIAGTVNEQKSLITASLNEIINGIGILQVFNYENETTKDFNVLSRKYMNEQLKEKKLHLTLGWNLIRLIGSLVTAVIVLYFGNGYLNIVGFVVTAGTIYAYNTYLSAIIEPVGILFREIGNLQHSLVRTERIFTLIDGEKEDDHFELIKPYEGFIKFDDVWFSYNEGNPILKGISFDIKENTLVGIVGHTGSGKSTLMNLLLRFNDLSENDLGAIYIDGININTYSKRTYRKHIGIILQEPVLFSGTLYDNISFGSGVSKEEAINILKSVGGEKILTKLPKGIDEEITRKGLNLSVGERQIISFARVLCHDPRILIMDEATANIDTETEEMIQHALNKIKENRTVIIIAHRLSTIKKADKIIVLEKGLKVEEGNHDELLTHNGVYANIYRSQVK